MEKLKRIIEEEIKLDKKIRNKVKELIKELKTIPHYEYLTYHTYRGELYSEFIELSTVKDNEEYLKTLSPNKKKRFKEASDVKEFPNSIFSN
jgi:hypothetical protein